MSSWLAAMWASARDDGGWARDSGDRDSTATMIGSSRAGEVWRRDATGVRSSILTVARGSVAHHSTATLAGMSRTTPAPAYDVVALFPGIEKFAVTAPRLPPRPGAPEGRTSHVGGPLRWPAGEPWPTCAADHLVPTEIPVAPAALARLRAAVAARNWRGYESVVADLASQLPGFAGINRRTGSALGYTVHPQAVPNPLLPSGQRRTADVPDPAPPPGSDLRQGLWRPNHPAIDRAAPGPA